VAAATTNDHTAALIGQPNKAIQQGSPFVVLGRGTNNSAFILLDSELFCTFAAAYVERFDLIATTRKNAKPMLFPWVPEPVEGPFQSTLPTQIHY
jgi:hypothetical protein